MSEERTEELIYKWKHFWMDQTQNSEEDRKNYFNRAFGVDANMIHDLSRRIDKRDTQLLDSAQGKLRKANALIDYIKARESEAFMECCEQEGIFGKINEYLKEST